MVSVVTGQFGVSLVHATSSVRVVVRDGVKMGWDLGEPLDDEALRGCLVSNLLRNVCVHGVARVEGLEEFVVYANLLFQPLREVERSSFRRWVRR